MSRFLLLATVLAVFLGLTSAQTFCEKYSNTTTIAATQAGLIQLIVVRAATGGTFNLTSSTGTNTTYVINGLFSPSNNPTYSIFHGDTKYRSNAPDYTASGTDQTNLVTKLVAYFGVLFGCNAPGYAQPAVTNMYAVHQNMNITNAMETYFNTQLATTLLSFGVSSSDVNNVAAPALGLFNRCGAPIGGSLGNGTSGLTQICGASDCPIATNSNTGVCSQYYGGSNGASAKFAASSLFVVLAALVAALVL